MNALDAIIRSSLRHRWLVLGGRRRAPRGRAGPASCGMPVDVFPDLTRAHRHRDHRGAGHGARGGRAARHLPARVVAERRARRAPHPIGVGGRHRRHLGRVRVGRGHLPRAADRRRAPAGASRCRSGVGAPELGPISSIMGEITFIALTSQNLSSDGAAAARGDDGAPHPPRQPGVSQVVPIGGDVRQYLVELDPDGAPAGAALRGRRSWRPSRRAARARPRASTSTRARSTWCAASGRARSAADLAATVVRVSDGIPLTVGQLATRARGAGAGARHGLLSRAAGRDPERAEAAGRQHARS